jgi:hypothetical protein
MMVCHCCVCDSDRESQKPERAENLFSRFMIGVHYGEN